MAIIKLLNSSDYVTNFHVQETSRVIHTGFSFHTHTGQELEVLFDFSSNVSIIQPRNTNSGMALPKLNGLMVKRDGTFNPEYFNVVTPMFLCEFHYKKEERFTAIAVDNSIISTLWNKSDIDKIYGTDSKDKSEINISEIKVFINKKGKNLVETYPLNKTLKEEIFLSPNGWNYKIDRDDEVDEEEY